MNCPLRLPAYLYDCLEEPAFSAALRTVEGAKAIGEEIFNETIKNHKIKAAFPGSDAQFVHDLLRQLCELAVMEFHHGRIVNTRMSDWLALVSKTVELESYSIDNPIRLACESVVLNMFCKFIKHPQWIACPAQFLEANSYFEKERTHWWRKQRAVDTTVHNNDKYEKLLADTPALLRYYNATLHASDLIVKPTLKHTVQLSALTVEGRSYENGQGRSIASECRHMIVRRLCDLPIKARPPRVNATVPKGVKGDSFQDGIMQTVGIKYSNKRKKNTAEEFSSQDKPKRERQISVLDSVKFDSIPKAVLGRISSSDWPVHLGLSNNFAPPPLTEHEYSVFTRSAESALLMLSSANTCSNPFVNIPPYSEKKFFHFPMAAPAVKNEM